LEIKQVNYDRSFLDQFNPHFEKIDEELIRTFSTRVALIEDIGKHALLSEGKRLRPLLFVLTAQLCGYDGKDVYRLSTLFEYIHAASLLHDDVIDKAELRRKKPSASNLWGNTAAVLAGDYLSSKASALAVSTENIEFLHVVTTTASKMTEGQVLELVHTNDWDTTREVYMDIIVSKTAELMSAACTCGGIIAGVNDDKIERLRKFGLNLGIAFQLMDDLLDYTLSEEEFGKPVGKDLREGKTTLPLIYTLSTLDRGMQREIKDFLKRGNLSDDYYYNLIAVVRDSGSLERIRNEARDYVGKAADSLEAFHESPLKEGLMKLNEYMIERNF
jgi:octaprenyl-diphosphate synthase